MHKLDPHTLFSIFEQGDEAVYREHNVEDVLKNPYVLVGMVVTGVENFYFMDKLYSLRHQQEYGKVRDNIKYKYFCKVYSYLKRTTIEEVENIYNIGSDFDIDRSLEALNELLFFFENIEEYEKCMVIKRYTDLLYGKKLEALL